MARIATRLFGPALLTNAAATKITVASNEKAIIRKIHVSNPSASAVNFTCSIGADAAGTRLYDAFSIPAGGVLDVAGPFTMEEAEIFQALGSTTNVLVLTVDGDRAVLS